MTPTIHETQCCSLVQIRARNDTTAQSITKAFRKNTKKHGAFIITTPAEPELVETLRGLDWAPIAEFKRCNATGYLTMWFKRK